MRLLSTLMAFSVFLLIGCNQTPSGNQEANDTSEEKTTEKTGQAFITDDEGTPNILQIAMGSKDHTTLVAAVQAAGLENSLVNAGPLTVFAPSNEAFSKLEPGTVENLLKPENKDALANILKYHVTPGSYSKDFLKKFKKLSQANGADLKVTVKGDDVMVGDAKIVGSVSAGNGIVHIVDHVLLPPTK